MPTRWQRWRRRKSKIEKEEVEEEKEVRIKHWSVRSQSQSCHNGLKVPKWSVLPLHPQAWYPPTYLPSLSLCWCCFSHIYLLAVPWRCWTHSHHRAFVKVIPLASNASPSPPDTCWDNFLTFFKTLLKYHYNCPPIHTTYVSHTLTLPPYTLSIFPTLFYFFFYLCHMSPSNILYSSFIMFAIYFLLSPKYLSPI